MLPTGYTIQRYGAWNLTLYGPNGIALCEVEGIGPKRREELVAVARGHAMAFDGVWS